MKAEMAKEKPNDEEFQERPCPNPAVGEDKVVRYITGDMTEAEHESFVAHIADCKHCMQEVVLWRTAEELVDREERPQQEVKPSA